jgi:hypothetical protein
VARRRGQGGRGAGLVRLDLFGAENLLPPVGFPRVE